jgi:hypothetical protein|tara:strand:+ start:323 stop:523 length:201 start_codon:yes stop_codon:yes gene_type:complete
MHKNSVTRHYKTWHGDWLDVPLNEKYRKIESLPEHVVKFEELKIEINGQATIKTTRKLLDDRVQGG